VIKNVMHEFSKRNNQENLPVAFLSALYSHDYFYYTLFSYLLVYSVVSFRRAVMPFCIDNLDNENLEHKLLVSWCALLLTCERLWSSYCVAFVENIQVNNTNIVCSSYNKYYFLFVL